MKTIRVLVYEPGKPGVVREVPYELKELQAIVGGYIETVRLRADIPELVVVCNEEGLLLNLLPNRSGLRGTFFVVRAEHEDYISLTEPDVTLTRSLLERTTCDRT